LAWRLKDRSGLRTSPVSWLGGSSSPLVVVSTGPLRGLPAALPVFLAQSLWEDGVQ